MPYLRRRSNRLRRRMGKKKRVMKRRYNRGRNNNTAHTVDTIAFTASAPPGGLTNSFATSALNVAGPVYEATPLTLGSLPRASGVANAYMYYRIRYVEVKFTPQVDTFAAGGAIGIPYLYYIKDKTGSIPVGINTTQFKTLGCRPIRLDDKSITIRYKPTVLTDTQYSPSIGAQASNRYVVSPWLITNTDLTGTFLISSVLHQGLKFFAENAGTGLNYNATMTVHCDFKLPSFPV